MEHIQHVILRRREVKKEFGKFFDFFQSNINEYLLINNSVIMLLIEFMQQNKFGWDIDFIWQRIEWLKHTLWQNINSRNIHLLHWKRIENNLPKLFLT